MSRELIPRDRGGNGKTRYNIRLRKIEPDPEAQAEWERFEDLMREDLKNGKKARRGPRREMDADYTVEELMLPATVPALPSGEAIFTLPEQGGPDPEMLMLGPGEDAPPRRRRRKKKAVAKRDKDEEFLWWWAIVFLGTLLGAIATSKPKDE